MPLQKKSGNLSNAPRKMHRVIKWKFRDVLTIESGGSQTFPCRIQVRQKKLSTAQPIYIQKIY